MALTSIGQPLEPVERDLPVPGLHQLRVKVSACGVCRTDLHVADGDLPDISLPIIPGHEIVGVIDAVHASVTQFEIGQRVGIPWLGHTCGGCWYCSHGKENLCDHPGFTGYTIDGGYAEYTIADARYCFALPSLYGDIEAAPLLCAGLIGYRSLQKAGACERLGIYGFGAAAHIVAQIAQHRGCEIYAFTRDGDRAAQEFAIGLGACWAGASDVVPPRELDAAIIFAPVGELVPYALRAVRKGGTVVCGGIHMSMIPAFDYDILWGERSIKSVANLTRQDAVDFLALAPKVPIRTHTQAFSLEQANEALAQLRNGFLSGAAVLTM
jgi:propanol-preferring alcohol dehydrogenase